MTVDQMSRSFRISIPTKMISELQNISIQSFIHEKCLDQYIGWYYVIMCIYIGTVFWFSFSHFSFIKRFSNLHWFRFYCIECCLFKLIL